MKAISLPKVSEVGNFDSIDPLDSRYYDAEIARYLSERGRIAYQAYVEAALGHTLAEFKVCSPEVAKQIETAAAQVTAEEVYAEEIKTKHDIKALGNVIKSKLQSQEARRFVHYGATSYDIIATATALQYRDVTQQVVVPRLIKLQQTLIGLSERYIDTVQVGRTHGQHGVPITFGFAIANYVSRLGESIEKLQTSADGLYGKFSGAVGAYNALSLFTDDPQKFEKALLAKLNLQPAPYSTQIIPGENILRLLQEYSITAGIMANLSHDMRHLQRSEIAEVREAFAKGQTGSSTMAHKRNPINFENVASLNKVVSAGIVSAQQNISSEHQRDLTDSASSRFNALIPSLVATMTNRLDRAMSKLEVDEEAMQKNLAMGQGSIAAEPLYLLFAKHGDTDAHERSKELSQQAEDEKRPLIDVVSKDPTAAKYLEQFSPQERQIIELPERYYTGKAAEKAKTIIANWPHP